MKADTLIHMACRNIGDSNDPGEFFEGTLRDGIMWLAALLGSRSMAGRFAIGIGRDKSGAAAAIELKRSGSSHLTDDLSAALDALLEGESTEAVLEGIAAPSTLPEGGTLDTWKPPVASGGELR